MLLPCGTRTTALEPILPSSSSGGGTRSPAPTSRSASPAAARRLGLVGQEELESAESDDLVRLAARGSVARPRSALGRHLSEHAASDPNGGAELVYWLRKLVFRSAWLDQRVKHGLVDVEFDERTGDFRYDAGHLPLPDLDADAPSWAAMQYRR